MRTKLLSFDKSVLFPVPKREQSVDQYDTAGEMKYDYFDYYPHTPRLIIINNIIMISYIDR